MQVSFSYPEKSTLDKFLQEKRSAMFSYQELNGTKKNKVENYDNDLNSILLAQGEEIWRKAKQALLNWQQFPPTWTRIYDDTTPLSEGNTVAVLFRLFGIWWLNSARIVYAFDEKNRFGFAYGTLLGHVESGEECFWIDRDETGKVYYHIKAFSKPVFWAARLAKPIARMYQRKFVRESMARMKKLSTSEETPQVQTLNR